MSGGCGGRFWFPQIALPLTAVVLFLFLDAWCLKKKTHPALFWHLCHNDPSRYCNQQGCQMADRGSSDTPRGYFWGHLVIFPSVSALSNVVLRNIPIFFVVTKTDCFSQEVRSSLSLIVVIETGILRKTMMFSNPNQVVFVPTLKTCISTALWQERDNRKYEKLQVLTYLWFFRNMLS